VDLALAKASAVDPARAAERWVSNGSPDDDVVGLQRHSERLSAYECALGALNACYSESSTLADSQGRVLTGARVAELKGHVLSKCIAAGDPLWHSTLYEWFIHKGLEDSLLAIESPYLEGFLGAVLREPDAPAKYVDLLWKHYVRAGRYSAAAHVLSQLADRMAPGIQLLYRVQYLALAVSNALAHLSGEGGGGSDDSKSRKLQKQNRHGVPRSSKSSTLTSTFLGGIGIGGSRMDEQRGSALSYMMDASSVGVGDITALGGDPGSVSRSARYPDPPMPPPQSGGTATSDEYFPLMDSERLSELEDRLEVAEIQVRIQDALRAFPSSFASSGNDNGDGTDVSRAVVELDSALFDISKLYNRFTVPFNLHECSLAIIAASHHPDSALVRLLWEKIVRGEYEACGGESGGGRSLEALSAKVRAVGARHFRTPSFFPLEFLVSTLEQLSAYLVSTDEVDSIGIEPAAGWVVDTMLGVGVSHSALLDAYERTLSSMEPAWQVASARRHLIRATAACISSWCDRVSGGAAHAHERHEVVSGGVNDLLQQHRAETENNGGRQSAVLVEELGVLGVHVASVTVGEQSSDVTSSRWE